MCGLILSRLLICNSDMCGSFHFCHLSFYSDTAFCLYFGGSGELGQKRLLRKTRPTTAKNGSFGPHNHLLNQDKWRRMAEGRAPSQGGQAGLKSRPIPENETRPSYGRSEKMCEIITNLFQIEPALKRWSKNILQKLTHRSEPRKYFFAAVTAAVHTA